MQLDEALRAEQVYAILAQHRGVVVLALEADQAIDHALQVVSQVGPRSIERMNVQEALVGVEEAALHALAGRDTVLVGRADELLHIRGDVRATLARRVRAVEAVLAEEVLALLAFHDRRLLLALLAHDDARRLSDDVDLILLLADAAQELDGILEVLHEGVQVQLLLHISLQGLLDHPEQEELASRVHANNLRERFDGVGCCRRQTLGSPTHDFGNDRHEFLLRALQVDADVSCLQLLLVASGVGVHLLVAIDQGMGLLDLLRLRMVVHRLAVVIGEFLPIVGHLRLRGLLRDPEELRLLHEVDAYHLGNADDDVRAVVSGRERRILVITGDQLHR
mmetsp:Transcript_44601/g.127945  ORF Transcript_44601/g.127945 Transcript_44601/m.127945 type:complete len:336 (-) Transcript_44601:103-1110(-)